LFLIYANESHWIVHENHERVFAHESHQQRVFAHESHQRAKSHERDRTSASRCGALASESVFFANTTISRRDCASPHMTATKQKKSSANVLGMSEDDGVRKMTTKREVSGDDAERAENAGGRTRFAQRKGAPVQRTNSQRRRASAWT
jgi:hypothetical protein